LQGWTETNAGRKFAVPAWEILPFLSDDGKVKFKASKGFGGKTLDFKWRNPIFEFFKLGFYTHGQRVYLACRILLQRPHIAGCLARRFPEIIVDEAQDTNVWLLVLLNLLRKNGTKVTLVGDPDQCIYEFSMADATFLPSLKEQWKIPEKPLSRSFRCNDDIAHAVRNIVGNTTFEGCGLKRNDYCKPVIVREPNKSFSRSISEFDRLLKRAAIPMDESVVLCRAHQQLEMIRGEVNYNDLQGVTKELALASFFRDARGDYQKAVQLVKNAIRQIVDEPEFWDALDDDPESEDSMRIELTIWKFAKSREGLPAVETNGTDWVDQLKANLSGVLKELKIKNLPKLGQKIRRTGLNRAQLALPLFRQQTLFPPVRHDTIHQVKGESIDGVLLLGSTKFFNSVVNAIDAGQNTEERRLAYVAMTRARHALLVGLPASHFDNHAKKWINWGFTAI
jgi:superfamily I DNA/RNA helicase